MKINFPFKIFKFASFHKIKQPIYINSLFTESAYIYIYLSIVVFIEMRSSQINPSINEIPDNMRNAQFGTNPKTTQIYCVIRVLQESIEFVKISLILPKIMENPIEAKRVLTGTQYEPALHLLDDYLHRRDQIMREKLPPLSNHGMIKIFDYFLRNHKMHELFPNLFKKLTVDDCNLLNTFERLYKICEQNLLRTARKDLNNERHFHKLYQENEKVKKSIKKLKADLAFQIVKERWQMAAKMAYLQKCEEKLSRKKQQNEIRMRDERSVKPTLHIFFNSNLIYLHVL